jgi:hypothetical protein
MSVWDELQPVWIHHSQTMEAIALARKESLREGRVDHSFHYATSRQSELWLEVHRAHSPAVSDGDVEKIYIKLFAARSKRWAQKPVHVVGLGCGGGRKDQLLLESLCAQGARVRFTPIDVSASLALLSAETTRRFCAEPQRPIVADLLQFSDLPEALAEFDKGEPRLYTFFGMMPNFEPDAILPILRTWIRPEDQLFLSANLAPAADESPQAYRNAMKIVRPQYANSETRNWLLRVLVDWGLEERATSYTLNIEEKSGLLRFVAAVEGLRLFFSYRYTPERLRSTLAAHGLQLGSGEISVSQEEGVWSLK